MTRPREVDQVLADVARVLERHDVATRARWWTAFNRGEWPLDFPVALPTWWDDPGFRVSRARVLAGLSAAIYACTEYRELCRAANAETMPGAVFDRWWEHRKASEIAALMRVPTRS